MRIHILKKSQQYILLFITLLIIFFLIFLSNIIIQFRNKNSEMIGENLKVRPYDSIYAIIDAPLVLNYPLLDKIDKILPKNTNLLTIFFLKNQIGNDEAIKKLIEKYNSVFKYIFENDILCLEIALDTKDGKVIFQQILYDSKCNRNYNYIFKVGDYFFRISVIIDNKYLINEAIKYVTSNA
ncbi:MAG: hypothetical protein QXS41_03930 [Candidatus Woesearchaeota archaeon]